MTILFQVNGVPQQVDDSRAKDALIDYLHEDLNLTGTKFCCGIGICRACTVSAKRLPTEAATPMIACSTALGMVAGLSIQTIEAVAAGGALAPVQQAFLREFAFQCGYCAPGFVMAATVFLDGLKAAPLPADQLDAAIEAAIGAHICRCTGYVRYHQALKATALAQLGMGG